MPSLTDVPKGCTPVGRIIGPTRISFPQGATTEISEVIAVLEGSRTTAVVTSATAFHPADHTWPDHPADRGTMIVATTTHTVSDCVMGAVSEATGDCFLGADIPVRRGTVGWTWFVAHVVDGDLDPTQILGQPAHLLVDPERRAGLSAGHTGCELLTLAVNRAMTNRWRKEVAVDVLGAPDFDTLALTSSRIHPYGSQDVYRIGKSLRRRGFDSAGLAAEIPELTEVITDQLTQWVRQDAAVWVDVAGPAVSDFRSWNCALIESTVSVPCGGTHVDRTSELGMVSVRLELTDDGETLTVDTSVCLEHHPPEREVFNWTTAVTS